MVSIEYTDDFLEGEPGPNFYWRGSPNDFLQLVIDLHRLGIHNKIVIDLQNLKYIQVEEGLNIILKSAKEGRTLCHKNKTNIIMELDKNIWRRVLSVLLTISFEKSHNYIEFDDLDLEESANVIISSET